MEIFFPLLSHHYTSNKIDHLPYLLKKLHVMVPPQTKWKQQLESLTKNKETKWHLRCEAQAPAARGLTKQSVVWWFHRSFYSERTDYIAVPDLWSPEWSDYIAVPDLWSPTHKQLFWIFEKNHSRQSTIIIIRHTIIFPETSHQTNIIYILDFFLYHRVKQTHLNIHTIISIIKHTKIFYPKKLLTSTDIIYILTFHLYHLVKQTRLNTDDRHN